MTETSEDPDVIRQSIRYSLHELRSRDGHHEFEHICRNIAQARICRTILPSTGPVGTGGDGGRDFESLRTYLGDRTENSFIGLGSGKVIVGACTLRAKDLPAKIKSDVRAIVESGQVDVVYAFCEADVPSLTRRRLREWALDLYHVLLEVIDGNALAEFLGQSDIYWIARRYLGQPDRMQRYRIQDLLREVGKDGGVPTLRDLSDDVLGATPTRYTKTRAAPYVSRPVPDGALREMLSTDQSSLPFVVVVGDPKAGKSRTLIEAVRAVSGDAFVLIPRDGAALHALGRRLPDQYLQSASVFVWLDDLSAVMLDHLTGSTLVELTKWATIVGTMTWQRYDQVLYSDVAVAATARAALVRADVVELAFELNESELDAARSSYPDEQVAGSIAESLVAGHALIARLKAGRAANPHGFAVVQAVVDWKRAGMDRPMRKSELMSLASIYLEALGLRRSLSSEDLEVGLAWALAPVVSRVALIRESDFVRSRLDDEESESIVRWHEEELGLYDEPGWLAFDFIVAEIDKPGSLCWDVPDQFWRGMIKMLSWPELHGVALVASTRGRVDVAWEILSDSSRELFDGPTVGYSYEERGDLERAQGAYEAAIDSGDPQRMSDGHAHLGQLLHRLGRWSEAVVHLGMVTDVSTLPGATSILTWGVVLEEDRSDFDGAEAMFRRVVEAGDRRLRGVAAARLAALRFRRDDFAGTIQACQCGLESVDPDVLPTLHVLLASALRAEGRLLEAEGVALRFANRCGPQNGFRAWSLLGLIREDLDDISGAIRAYERALKFDGDPD